MFLFFWFWYVFVIAVMAAQLTNRLALIFVRDLRMPVLRTYFVDFNSNAARSANTYLKHCNIGDWFLLTQIGQNVDPFFFEDFMQELENLQYSPNENHENGENQQEALLNNSNGVNIQLNTIHNGSA